MQEGACCSGGEPSCSPPKLRARVRGSTEPFSAPWMIWRAFWPPSSQRCFLQVSVLDPAADLAGPRPDYGTCHSDFGAGIPFFCGLYKGCWCRSAPCAAVCLTANYLHGGPYGRRRALLAQKPFVLCTAIRGCPPGLDISHTLSALCQAQPQCRLCITASLACCRRWRLQGHVRPQAKCLFCSTRALTGRGNLARGPLLDAATLNRSVGRQVVSFLE